MARRKKHATIKRTLHPLPTMTRDAAAEARVASRLAELAASAMDRYLERLASGKDNVLDDLVGHGVISHPHAWCFDLRGRWANLAVAGCVFAGWLPPEDQYWEIVGLRLRGRRIEISQFTGSFAIEVSVTYTEAEKERLWERLR